MMLLDQPLGPVPCSSLSGGMERSNEEQPAMPGWADRLIDEAMRSADRTGGVAATGPSTTTLNSTSQEDSSVVGRAPVELVLTPATEKGDDGLAWNPLMSAEDWMGALLASPSPGQFGCRLVWGMSRGFLFPGLSQLLKYAKPIASEEAFSKKAGLFPIPVDFSQVKSWAWPLDDFSEDQCEVAWVLLSAAALNDFYGLSPPYPTQRRGRVVEKCLQTIRERVCRFLKQSVDPDISFSSVWEDVSKKQINYDGEEVAVAQMLTVDQVFKSLPPVGHGGSVELAPLLQGRTRFLIENPEQVLLRSPPLQKVRNSAKVHIAKGEEIALFRLLFERGVIDFVPENEVFSDCNGPFLSGLFGVPKPNKMSPKGAPVLRLIMNLIPINRTLDVILGDIGELPSASCWQQLVLLENDSISISQADMASAFYLFRLPVAWQKYLCFNHRLARKDVGLAGSGYVFPSCRVLPMGWSSSVGVMQMASRELMRRAQLLTRDELSRQSLVPKWFVEFLPDLTSSETWWQVYLDNFMAAEVTRNGKSKGQDVAYHKRAVAAWEAGGVLCSEDKHVYSASVATELGVEVNGELGLMGGSATRIFKAMLATLGLVKHPLPSIRIVQVVLGRWIFLLQYRRPAMAVLSRSWDYINKTGNRQRAWSVVCAEMSRLLCLSPLLQSDLRTTFSPVITCSDASEKGGAVALATGLSISGASLSSRLSVGDMDPKEIKVLVISAFNGIGGCFRAYDLIGVRPVALISIEIDPAAKRVVRVTWPHCLEVSDVCDVDLAMIRGWSNMFPRLEEVHIWGGFPCVHLSSARSDRLNLEGEGSNLFFQLVRIIEMAEQTFEPAVPVHFVIENVYSMDVSARQEISLRLDVKPVKLDPADCSPMSRPRLAWLSRPIESQRGISLIDHGDFVEVKMDASFPALQAWITPGWGQAEGEVIYPTFMKSIVRRRPPPNPAGLRRCDPATVGRWQSDEFRFPPYQYSRKYLLRDDNGQLRYLEVSERELLMGMGFGATEFCFNASYAKRHPTEYWDKRYSLLGDGFAMISFAWVAGQLCRPWINPPSPQQIVDRLGLAPGASLAAGFQCPMRRDLLYGGHGICQDSTSLVAHISRHVSHNGSDVSISLGVPFNPRQGHHFSLRAPWWKWRILFATKWKFSSHINSLEMRMIVQAVRWRARQIESFNSRWLHLADSMVCNYILSKGRTSSHLLQGLVRQHAAILMALNSMELHGHVDSTENPTDEASRA